MPISSAGSRVLAGKRRPLGLVKPGAFSQKSSVKVLQGTSVSAAIATRPSTTAYTHAHRQRRHSNGHGRRPASPLSQEKDEYRKAQAIRHLPRVEHEPQVEKIITRYSTEVRRQAHDSLMTSRLMDDILENSRMGDTTMDDSEDGDGPPDVSLEVNRVIANTIDSFVAKSGYAAGSGEEDDDNANDGGARRNAPEHDLVHQLKADIENLLLEADVDDLNASDLDALLEDRASTTRNEDQRRSKLIEQFATNPRRRDETSGDVSPSWSERSQEAQRHGDGAADAHQQQPFNIEERLQEVDEIFYGNERKHSNTAEGNEGGSGAFENRRKQHAAPQGGNEPRALEHALEPVFQQFDSILSKIDDPVEREKSRRDHAHLRQRQRRALSSKRRQPHGQSSSSQRGEGPRGRGRHESSLQNTFSSFHRTLRQQQQSELKKNSPKSQLELPKRLRQSYGERYRAYYRECVRQSGGALGAGGGHISSSTAGRRSGGGRSPSSAQPVLSFDQWLQRTKAEEAAHAKQLAEKAEERYASVVVTCFAGALQPTRWCQVLRGFVAAGNTELNGCHFLRIRYEAVRLQNRRQAGHQGAEQSRAQGSRQPRGGSATPENGGNVPPSLADMNAREVELQLVANERELKDINEEMRQLAADRQKKRREIAAGKKSLLVMADTLRQLVPLAAKLGVSFHLFLYLLTG